MVPINHGQSSSMGSHRPYANMRLPLDEPQHFKNSFHGWYFRRISEPGETATWARYHKVPMAYTSDELGRMVRQSLSSTSKAKRPARTASEQYHLLGDYKKDMVDKLIEEMRRQERNPSAVWVLGCVSQDVRPVVKRSYRGGLVRTEDARQVDVILKREPDVDAGSRTMRMDGMIDTAVHIEESVCERSPVDIDIHVGRDASPRQALPPPLPLESPVAAPKGILKSSKPMAPPVLPPPYPVDVDELSPLPLPAIHAPPPVPPIPADGYPPPPPTPPGARHTVSRNRPPSPPYPTSPPPPPLPSPPPPVASVASIQTEDRIEETLLDCVDSDSSESDDRLPPPPPPMPQPKSTEQSRSSRRSAAQEVVTSRPSKTARKATRERPSTPNHESSKSQHIINITIPSNAPDTKPRQNRAPPPSRDRRRGRSRSRSRSRRNEFPTIHTTKRSSSRSRSRGSSRRSSSTISTRVRTIFSSSSADDDGYDSPPTSASLSPRHGQMWLASRREEPRNEYQRAPLNLERRHHHRETRSQAHAASESMYVNVPASSYAGSSGREDRRRQRSRSRSRDRVVYYSAPAPPWHPPSQRRQRSPSPSRPPSSCYHHRRTYEDAPGPEVFYGASHGAGHRDSRRDYPPPPPLPLPLPAVHAHQRPTPPHVLLPPIPAAPRHGPPRLQAPPVSYEEWVWQVPSSPPGQARRNDVPRERLSRRSRSRSRGRSGRSRSRSRSRVTYVRHRQREERERERPRGQRGGGGGWVVLDADQGAAWPWGRGGGVDVLGQGEREGRWR